MSPRSRPDFSTPLGAAVGVALALALSVPVARAEPEPGATEVELTETPDGWQLLRGGQPYRIQGAGGSHSLERLAAAGANSTRTWGADGIDELLDEAHRHGISVTIGIWLGHERHGFDYNDPDRVAEQYERAKEAVLRYRNHPALLIWAIGNEMEGFEEGDDAAIWSAVNNIAAMAKKLDPHHPTMTVLAEIGGKRVEYAHRLLPDVDIVGINSYGGASSLPERYRAAGGTKPYIVTETGPPGAWEVGKTAWGAPLEPTSTEKARRYASIAQTLAADSALNLGTYVFLWGHKREATATWFGMFLANGKRTGAVDAMTKVWTGRPPENQAPYLSSIDARTSVQVEPGETVEAQMLARDRDGDELSYAWVLEPEESDYMTGGDARPDPAPLPDAILENGRRKVRVRLPSKPGGYRLYGYVYDDHGGAAVGNIPLRVLGEVETEPAQPVELPLVIYGEDREAVRYVPSGYMGSHGSVTMDESWSDQPKRGDTCLKVTYAAPGSWAGVVWQHPANDWGERPGGFDLSAARRLTFWARGEAGGERVEFGYGLLTDEKPFHDTDRDEMDGVELSREWKQYSFDLSKKNLERIKSGFYWVAAGQGRPLTFFLDEIRYE